MRLSAPEPSFLDQRNAILQADAINAPAGQDRDRIWAVFASRGMGWFASVDSAGDIAPIEDFSLPPAPAAGSATVQGVVSDDGAGIEAVEVGFSGHDTGLGPQLSAVTDASGAYAITDVPAGAYPKLRANVPPGYEGALSGALTVPSSGTVTRDFPLRRNWSSIASGAAVRSFTGTDFGFFGCGPSQALDGDPTTVWSTDAPAYGGAKQMVVALPEDVTVTSLQIDPTPGCGDTVTAELRDYRIKFARDDDGDPGAFTTVATGRFGPADLGAPREVALSGSTTGVRYVELQALTNNGHPYYMDLAELKVYGHRTTPVEGGGGTAAPEVATLAVDAAATTATLRDVPGVGHAARRVDRRPDRLRARQRPARLPDRRRAGLRQRAAAGRARRRRAAAQHDVPLPRDRDELARVGDRRRADGHDGGRTGAARGREGRPRCQGRPRREG